MSNESQSLLGITRESLANVFSTDEHVWKILIFDVYGKEVLAPLLTVGKLKSFGVSLLLPINVKRSQIKNSCAVYFVQATEENLNLICQDIEQNLYMCYYIDFIDYCESEFLELMVTKFNAIKHEFSINRVYDRYSLFIVDKENVFNLKIAHVLTYLYWKPTNDLEIINITKKITKGLVSICSTLECLPAVYYQDSVLPSNFIATQFIETMLGHAKQAPESKLGNLMLQNKESSTALVILDRLFDLIPIFAHYWTYDHLISDLLDRKNNFVSIKNVKYDLTDDTDKFYQSHQFSEFSTVISACASSLKTFSEKVKGLQTKKTNIENSVAQFDVDQTLSDASNILKEKSDLDKHTNICEAMLKRINARNIDKFADLAASIIASSEIKQTLLSQVKALALDPSSDPSDVLRLLLATQIQYCGEIETFIDEVVYARFQRIPSPITFLRSILQNNYTNVLNTVQKDKTAEIPDQRSKLFGSVISKSKGILKQLSLTSGYNNNIISLLNKILWKQIPENFFVKYLAPASGTIDRIILFIIGGGNYHEVKELQEWASKHKITLIYGSTEFDNAAINIEEIEKLI